MVVKNVVTFLDNHVEIARLFRRHGPSAVPLFLTVGIWLVIQIRRS